MFKKNHLYLLILFFVCLFSRIFTSIYYIEDIDSLRFAFSLYDYDITKLQPHFPGYPVFCFIAKLIYVVTGSMGITFSIIGGVSVYFLIYFMSYKLCKKLQYTLCNPIKYSHPYVFGYCCLFLASIGQKHCWSLRNPPWN